MEFQTINASSSPETQMNENFETINHASVYGKRQPVTTGLTWGYYGGRWGGFSVANGTLTLTNTADNYLVVARATGVISTSTATTNWNNPADYARVYKLTVAGSVVTVTEDHRAGKYGVHGDTRDVGGIRTETGATYSVVDTDKHIIANRAGTVTLTLGTATKGRELTVRTIQAQQVDSASSNVVPLAGGAAGTAIVAATAGKWALLVADGTSWQVQASN